MSSHRDNPNEFDASAAQETPTPTDVAAAIGTDERRMQVRAYNYWVSLLDGRDFPSIEDLEPNEVEDFSSQSVLLDFTCGRDNPAIPYVGAAIREECGFSDDMRTISDVPGRSLLSRLTDHYMQIIANRAPVGFEAEYENQSGEGVFYRGILMPFSSDGDMIDFIYGVISWKQVDAAPEALIAALSAPQPATIEIAGIADGQETPYPVDAGSLDHEPYSGEAAFEDETSFEGEEPLELTDELQHEPRFDGRLEDETVHESDSADHFDAIPFEAELSTSETIRAAHFSELDDPLNSAAEAPSGDLSNAGLAGRLWTARETAETVKAGEGRTRTALYKALSLAYDFAVAASHNPDEYAELLEEAGVKAQARAPMTPVVKLVFGADYDKARLTEFAAALSYATRQKLEVGGFESFIEAQSGGLKALVAAERQARRPESNADSKTEVARARLRSAASISLSEFPIEQEFALIVTRRNADGTHEPVALVQDEALVERAIRRAV